MTVPGALGNRVRQRSVFLNNKDVNVTVDLAQLGQNMRAYAASVAMLNQSDGSRVRLLNKSVEL